MDAETRMRSRALSGLAACGFVALLLLIRISAFGIWDPWELSTADAARKLAAGQDPGAPVSASVWLVSRGFAAFGIHEWAGRLPIALAGIVAVLVAFALGSRYGDTRTGVYAALIAGTSPLFVFNARAMLGEAPAFAAQGLVAFCATHALLPVHDDAAADRPASRRAWLWLGATALTAALAIWVRGALLGALPPLAAAVIVALFGAARTSQRRLATWIAAAATAALGLLVLRDVLRDSSEPSLWLGGRAMGAEPPTFDRVLEKVFHSFAPWSALLPLAIGSLWLRTANLHDSAREPEAHGGARLGVLAVLWAAFGYAAQTIFVSRYGSDVSFLPLVALALVVALFLRDLEREDQPSWILALTAVLLAGLVVRDYALYPHGPVNGMPLSSFEIPAIFNPKRIWAALLGVFALCAFFSLGVTRESVKALELAAPYRFFRAQWRRGAVFRAWLIAFAILVLAVIAFGVVAYVVPDKLRIPTLAIRWVRRLVFFPALLCAAMALAQLLLWAFSKLGSWRFAPLLASGVTVGMYAAQGFLPALSGHFSPREVYATYNALAAAGEELGEYNVGGRAAAYYAEGPIRELESVDRLIEHLDVDSRRWAAFPADELPEINRRFRERRRTHLFVADARSARVVLASNRPVAGRKDENFLSKVVLNAPPSRIQHPVAVNFENRIELLGYDLDLPHDGYVGAGESFTLRWYFRAISPGPDGYKIFVHIDGQGQRIHGDHEPVDAKYPLRLWEPGDVIVDEQKLDVPSNYRAGDYKIHMGFYSGETRLTIQSGPNDGANRAIVGVLRIQ